MVMEVIVMLWVFGIWVSWTVEDVVQVQMMGFISKPAIMRHFVLVEERSS